MAAVGWVTAIIQRAAASQKRINALLEQEPEIKSGEEQVELKGNIDLKNISFTYPDTGIKAIQDVNLSLKEGQTIGLIGKTGSGKSTLVNLLMRQYDVDSGEILVEGKDIKSLDTGAFRQQVGFVPQDNFLFSDSIQENIFWGGSGEALNREEVETVAKIADLHKDIEDFKRGYETVLGERGITLSGGQKQRLSIARAIYGNPRLLVFDDSFSAVDTRTEAAILEQLSRFIENRTTVLVSHRVSTVKNADHIVVLEKGKIIEEGTHDELIANHRYYYSLYKKQLLEKELRKAV